MFTIITSVILFLYLLQILFFRSLTSKKFEKISEADLPAISIVVAARNEEKNIETCLVSLDAIEYDEEKLQIIIIDDHSTDRTPQIIKSYIKDKPKFLTIVPQKAKGSLKGKANAIANGIEFATGEIILSTDADCTVNPLWAKTTVSYYKENVAMVCGYTNQEEDTTFRGMQSVDFLFLLSVAAGTMNAGKPLSCIGNNMSYRKSVYHEVGGYESMPFSITEDFQLLAAFHKLGKYKIIYPGESNMLVTSKACPNLTSLYWQKKRWGVGGLDSDIAGFAVMAVSFLLHVATIFMPVFMGILWLLLLPVKWLIDFILIGGTYKRLKLKLKLKNFLAFEFYYNIYVVLLPFAVMFNRKIKWKDRKF